MRRSPIVERFRASPAYRALRARLRDGNAAASNLAGSSKAVLQAALAHDLETPVLVVTSSSEIAERWATDLEALLGEERVGLFPQWETLPYEDRAPQREVEGQRLDFLLGLLGGSITIGVAGARALLQRVPAPAALEARILRLTNGDRIDLEAFETRLVAMGFEREAMVAEVGTFSVRGGIVDVFGFRNEHPVRIELADDEVCSIREFDIGTQRSVQPLSRVEIVPARERPEADVLPAEGRPVLRSIAEYFHPDTVVVIDEPDRVASVVDETWEMIRRRYEVAARPASSPDELYLDRAGFDGVLEPFRCLSLFALHVDAPDEEGPLRFSTRSPEPVRRSVTRLIEILRQDLDARLAPIIVCDNLGQLERLAELLPADLESVVLDVGALDGGFVVADAGLAVYTDHEIFDRRHRPIRRRRYATAGTRVHVAEIRPSDYLVHLDYGVGRYAGLERLQLAAEAEVEALKLEYADGEILYVPVEQIEQVEKFTGPEGTVPAIHRLASGRWQRQKARTKAAIVELTEELLRVHAEREWVPGFAFSVDTDWQREMENAFLYEDTPDQRIATDAVKRDMESDRPMDRLICGDVGYGKTEVAVRAAFKAVQDGRQVAILAPTTVLVAQHFETVTERLADFPVRVGRLSRFNTATETTATLAGLASGRIDIVVGTHRLLSSDVEYADLGLIIIDEEQRFGVKHKERLRAIRTSVDVLTLSATPIPRTLQMSLMGLRDMSLIETPPPNRTPIVTWVAQFDEELVEDAIRREVDRGGQVFFVHNRVQTIDTMARRIERLVPDLRISIAHGQLGERDLEEVMMRFFQGDVDVLVTSAIIESGLDVPNANTILIDRADRFGLADLYQLRGRVGRSHHRAYCYLLTPPRREMTREAEERLRVLEEHTDLGAGYRIALHDLEMRGAGDLLGPNQSGFIAAVGFDTYLRLVDETVAAMRDDGTPPTIATELAFDADAYLPSGYISDDQQKLALYRRLARLSNLEAIDDFRAELVDRYGIPPPPADHLCVAAKLKVLGSAAGADRIRVSPRTASAELRWGVGVEPKLKAIQAAAGKSVEVTVTQVDPLHLKLAAETFDDLIEALEIGLRAWGADSIVTG